ncbi:MAG: SdrD B-like domain-containing protein [Pirellulales bacterium]
MAWWSRLWKRRSKTASDARSDERRADVEAWRRCALEEMETRRQLAVAPLQLGITYLEEDSGADLHGDTFEVQFEGGAPQTQLTRLVLDTDQGLAGYSRGDLIFDTLLGGYGADEAFPLTVLVNDGVQSVSWQVVDGGQQLTFDFIGFEAGDRLVFSIDVDEIQQFTPGDPLSVANEGIDPIASGVEFQGSQARGDFAAPNYFDATGSGEFRNVYDPLFAGTNLLRTEARPQGLRPDNFNGQRDRSTGTVAAVTQQFRPASLCGSVYVDTNQNGLRDAGEAGLAGVRVRAVPLETIAESSTRSLLTDADGNFCFQELVPGSYRLEEDQPPGYFDGLDRPGQVDGQTRGTARNPGDAIDQIELAGGDTATNYLFGEVPPSKLSGQVLLTDPEGNCDGPLAQPLAQVEIRLFDAQQQLVATTTTDVLGRYEFTQLRPGMYTIVEVTPAGLLDGDEHVGSLGGSATDDRISSIQLPAGTSGTDYDFCEHEPAVLSGFVYHDHNNDGQFQLTETPLPGATVQLLNAQGQVLRSTQTDPSGFYLFDNLPAGVYRLVELQPAGWLDGKDATGTIFGVPVGTVAPEGDDLREINLRWGDLAINYLFGELLPASLSGTVQAHPGETCGVSENATPLADVLLELLDEQGNIVASTRTDAQGNYSFHGLRPGVYRVRETQPASYFDGAVSAGTAGGTTQVNLIDQIHLASGQDAEDYEFCELPPATLSGYVFQDGPELETDDGLLPPDIATRRDGQRTSDDVPLAGVVLELRDGITGAPLLGDAALPGSYPAGEPIRTVTDAQGRYAFSGLRGNRSYAVFEIQPAGLFDGIDTPGTTSGLAFNPPQVVPADILADLTVSPGTDAIIRIPLTYGGDSAENNFSELRVRRASPPPVQPPSSDPPPWLPPAPPPPPPPAVAPPAPYVQSPTPQLPLLVPVANPAPELITGGSSGAGATWHLSVLDAGRPRGSAAQPIDLAQLWGRSPLLARWRSSRLKDAQWLVAVGLPQSSTPALNEFLFGAHGAIPVAGDFDGDGRTDLGVYLQGEWFLDVNGNGQWDDGDLWAQLGTAQDRPIVGDWNGDGKDDIGIFGLEWSGDKRQLAREPGLPDFHNEPKPVPKNVPPATEEATDGLRFLQLTADGQPRADLIDHVFRYGQPEDFPVAGDWDGDGIDTIGVFRQGRWYLDHNGDGAGHPGEPSIEFGQPGDIPVHGDFDGDGIDEIGVFRRGVWLIDINHNHQLDAQDRIFELGSAGDTPVVGDWNADGTDEPGLFGHSPRTE